MQGLEKSRGPCTAPQPPVPLHQHGRVSRDAAAPREGTSFSHQTWREFQHLWSLSTYVLTCQHQQWARRGDILSLAQQAGGGLCEMHEAALCQQPRHVSLHRRHRHGTGLAGADRDGGAGSRRLWTSSFSVTGHCISSGHTPRAGFTFLSVVFKALLAATTNDAWLRFQLTDLRSNHRIFVGFPLWNEQPASSHRTGTHAPLKHLLLGKLSALSSLSFHWKTPSPAFLTSASRCNNICAVSTESGSNPGIWGWDFQMSLRNLSDFNLLWFRGEFDTSSH